MKSRSTLRSAGFSLIEALVALAVISVGLLGIAVMQALALHSTHDSRSDSLVAIEAASLAGAMQANPGYWQAGLFPASFTVTGTTISDSTLSSQDTDCATDACTAVEMAGYDLNQWGSDLQTQVPGATGSITCQIASPSICTITVNWTEKAPVALSSGTASSATSVNKSYTLVSQF